MRAVIDNNVIIDAVASRSPFNRNADKIVLLAGDGRFDGCITTNSATDIFYVMKKAAGASAAKNLLTHLFNLFEVLTVAGEDCREALLLPMDDFEDALLVVCAKKVKADYIVSRDEDFLKTSSPVPIVSPKEFLMKFNVYG